MPTNRCESSNISFLSEIMMLGYSSPNCQQTTSEAKIRRHEDFSQLSSLSLGLDVIGDDRDVSEVEGGVDFIHKVKRGGLIRRKGSSGGAAGKAKADTHLENVERKDQGQGTQCLRAAKKYVSSRGSFDSRGANTPSLHRTSWKCSSSSSWVA